MTSKRLKLLPPLASNSSDAIEVVDSYLHTSEDDLEPHRAG